MQCDGLLFAGQELQSALSLLCLRASVAVCLPVPGRNSGAPQRHTACNSPTEAPESHATRSILRKGLDCP